jgi:hypothetical protein
MTSVTPILGLLPKGFSLYWFINGLVGRETERMSADEEQFKARSHLTELAVAYFKKEGYKVNSENIKLEGHSGVARHFDLIVQKGRLEQGVWVRDWNRTIGVNVIINLDTSSEDVDLSSPIMIGEKFSDHAKSYSNRRKITLLTKQKIGSFR